MMMKLKLIMLSLGLVVAMLANGQEVREWSAQDPESIGIEREIPLAPMPGESDVDYAMRVAITYQEAYHALYDYIFGEEGIEVFFLNEKQKWNKHLNDLQQNFNTTYLISMCANTAVSVFTGYMINEIGDRLGEGEQ